MAPTMPALPSGIKISLPAGLDSEELEIRIEVRSGGRLVGEAELRKGAPVVGAGLKLALDLKRG